MENKYRTTSENFYFAPNPFMFIPNDNLHFASSLVASDLLLHPAGDFQTRFFHLQQKYDELQQQNQQLKNQLQILTNRHQHPHLSKKKLIRRREDELDKKYACCYQNCKKHYASELALNLHIKTKHKGATRKQREDLAKQIIMAQDQGRPAPFQPFRLPAGFVQKYRREHLLGKDGTTESE